MTRPPQTDPIVVGRIVRPHGVRGEIVVEPLSDNPTRFVPGSRLWSASSNRRGEPGEALTVIAVRPHQDRLLVSFEEVTDRDEAEALRGRWLEVPRGEIPSPDEGSYYFFDLVDCRCVDRGEGELGTVSQVIEDGGGFLLEISGPSGRLLVPFVRDYLVHVDVEAGLIELELPEGLVEACRSKS